MLNEAERRAAQTIQVRHGREVERIRADDHLSDAGKRSAIARATLAARASMAQLRSASDACDGQRRTDLQYRLFGMGSRTAGGDVLAARDARDRAAQIKTAGEAARMLAQAERAGDTSMARAVFEKVWDMVPLDPGSTWGDVGAGYLSTRPAEREAAAELAGLLDPGSLDRFADRLSTRLTVPAEVATGSIEAFAAERQDDGDAA